MKSALIINTPKSCEECSLCVAVQGKHYCPGKGTYIQNGERDCSCPLVELPGEIGGSRIICHRAAVAGERSNLTWI